MSKPGYQDLTQCDELVKDLQMFRVESDAPYEIALDDEWAIIDASDVIAHITKSGLRGYSPEAVVVFWALHSAKERCEYTNLQVLMEDFADTVDADVDEVREYSREVKS